MAQPYSRAESHRSSHHTTLYTTFFDQPRPSSAHTHINSKSSSSLSMSRSSGNFDWRQYELPPNNNKLNTRLKKVATKYQHKISAPPKFLIDAHQLTLNNSPEYYSSHVGSKKAMEIQKPSKHHRHSTKRAQSQQTQLIGNQYRVDTKKRPDHSNLCYLQLPQTIPNSMLSQPNRTLQEYDIARNNSPQIGCSLHTEFVRESKPRSIADKAVQTEQIASESVYSAQKQRQLQLQVRMLELQNQQIKRLVRQHLGVQL